MTNQARDQRILLVRHGQTEWNSSGRYLSRSDVDLDETGRQQANRLAGWAVRRGVQAVHSSPARRAMTTAAAIADAVGVATTVDRRLRELDFGMAEGHTLAELRTRQPEIAAAFEVAPATNGFPGGEPAVAACLRMDEALRDALSNSDAGTILVVSHNTALRLYLCHVLGIPLDDYRRRLPEIEHGTHTELAVVAGAFALRRFNAATGESLIEDQSQVGATPGTGW